MIHLAVFVTDFADAGVVVPLFLAVALCLALLRRMRLALCWVAVTLGVWGTMLLLKLGGYTLDHVDPDLQLRLGLVTASGHAAAAATAYGALAGLLAGSAAHIVRRSTLAAILVATIIGGTRVLLHEHTPAEAIVGGAIGIAGAYIFARLAGDVLHGARRAALLVAALVTLATLHGAHVTLEGAIAETSTRALDSLRL